MNGGGCGEEKGNLWKAGRDELTWQSLSRGTEIKSGIFEFEKWKESL